MNADRDELDSLLDASVPDTATVTKEAQSDLTAMVLSTQSASRRRIQRRGQRLVVTGAVVAAMVGGVGAAAAMSPPSWAPWAEPQDYTSSFQLPSGAECDYALGNVTSNDPALTNAVKKYLSRTDVIALADINGALRANRVGGSEAQNEDGQKTSRSRDMEFNLAVSSAVFKLVNYEMERQGWDVIDNDDLGLSIEGQGYCPGAKW